MILLVEPVVERAKKLGKNSGDGKIFLPMVEQVLEYVLGVKLERSI